MANAKPLIQLIPILSLLLVCHLTTKPSPDKPIAPQFKASAWVTNNSQNPIFDDPLLASKMMRDCLEIGTTVIAVTKGSASISNIDPHLTWRTSCTEKRPIGRGIVYALCDADLVSKNGNKRKIFYWAKDLPDGHRSINYHLCE